MRAITDARVGEGFLCMSPKNKQAQWTKTAVGLVVVGALYLAQQSGVIQPLQHKTDEPPSTGTSEDSDVLAQRAQCRVLKVFDGDTFSCDLNGNGRMDSPQEKIRLLGIDAPETHFSAKLKRKTGEKNPKDEPYAMEARDFVAQRLAKKQVILVMDETPTDKYGRTLAFVLLNPKADVTAENTLNGQLLKAGLVKPLFIGNNRRFEGEFNALERESRNAGRGLWGG